MNKLVVVTLVLMFALCFLVALPIDTATRQEMVFIDCLLLTGNLAVIMYKSLME